MGRCSTSSPRPPPRPAAEAGAPACGRTLRPPSCSRPSRRRKHAGGRLDPFSRVGAGLRRKVGKIYIIGRYRRPVHILVAAFGGTLSAAADNARLCKLPVFGRPQSSAPQGPADGIDGACGAVLEPPLARPPKGALPAAAMSQPAPGGCTFAPSGVVAAPAAPHGRFGRDSRDLVGVACHPSADAKHRLFLRALDTDR